MTKWVRWILVAAAAGMLMASGCAEADPAVTADSDMVIDPVDADEDAGNDTPSDGGSSHASTGGGTSPSSGGTTGTGTSGNGGKPDSGMQPDPSLVRVTDTCIENRDFVGQMYPKPDEPNNGGMVVTAPFDATYDAGIAALYAASPASGEVATGLNLQISNATVTATGYGTTASKRFWVQDGQSAVHVRMETAVTIGDQEAVVKVGSKLSFTVKAMRNYSGVLQVDTADGWTFTGTEQPVYLDDRTGGDITTTDLHRLIRVTGVLSGTPEPCGGSAKCWTFNYKGKTDVRFRSASAFIDTGACVTFVGPAGLFNGTPQLDTANYAWLWSND